MCRCISGCVVQCAWVERGWCGTAEVRVKYVWRLFTPWRDRSLADLILKIMNGFQT
jgi:hypothetical protein